MILELKTRPELTRILNLLTYAMVALNERFSDPTISPPKSFSTSSWISNRWIPRLLLVLVVVSNAAIWSRSKCAYILARRWLGRSVPKWEALRAIVKPPDICHEPRPRTSFLLVVSLFWLENGGRLAGVFFLLVATIWKVGVNPRGVSNDGYF